MGARCPHCGRGVVVGYDSFTGRAYTAKFREKDGGWFVPTKIPFKKDTDHIPLWYCPDCEIAGGLFDVSGGCLLMAADYACLDYIAFKQGDGTLKIYEWSEY